MPFDNTNFVTLSVRDQRELMVIQKMRALIGSPDRWTKGFYERRGRFCLIGALWQTTESGPLRWRVVKRLASAAAPQCGWPDREAVVTVFNDAPTTKHQDVLALLDRAMTTGGSDAV